MLKYCYNEMPALGWEDRLCFGAIALFLKDYYFYLRLA